MSLARHRPQAADLPEQPLVDLDPTTLVGRIELAGLAPEVLQDGAGFEDRQRRAAGPLRIDDGGHTAVGTDRLEGRRELLAGPDVHRPQHIGQAHLFQRDRDFPAVRRGPVPEFDRGGHDVLLSRRQRFI
ncbi:hypothetical protein D3C80_1648410 [compost metagenome]